MASVMELLKRIAQLESMNDYLLTEIEHLDMLMQRLGFQRGIETVKCTAEEIIRRGHNPSTKPDETCHEERT